MFTEVGREKSKTIKGLSAYSVDVYSIGLTAYSIGLTVYSIGLGKFITINDLIIRIYPGKFKFIFKFI
jgi:hypothetical protein